MKYFIDTESIEDGETIDLISIGIVAEDGREYYAVNKNCNFKKASDWVEENVLKPIGLNRLDGANINERRTTEATRITWGYMKLREFIKIDLIDFLNPELHEVSEFWARHGDSDWTAFHQLLGTTGDLPEWIPSHCRSVQQECDRLGGGVMTAATKCGQNALENARWNKKAWEFLNGHIGKI